MGRVIVVGSINMDLVAYTSRIPKAGESLPGGRFSLYPGGKGANQAIAAKKLGADALLVGCIGADSFGEQVLSFIASQGVDVRHVQRDDASQTGVGVVLVEDGGENRIIVIAGANMSVKPFEVSLQSGDVVVCQMEIPLERNVEALETSRKAGAVTILNLAPALPFERFDLVDYLIVNEVEGSGISALPPETTAITTLGPHGAVSRGKLVARAEGIGVEAVDSTGAGDCFVGAFAAGLALGRDAEQSLYLANAAAAVSVTREGAATSMPSREEALSCLERSEALSTS